MKCSKKCWMTRFTEYIYRPCVMVNIFNCFCNSLMNVKGLWTVYLFKHTLHVFNVIAITTINPYILNTIKATIN